MRREPIVSNGTPVSVGMDVDASFIHVAMLLPGEPEPVEWRVVNEERAIRRLAQRLLRTAPGGLRACYEAGPTGYALQRKLQERGVSCDVIAPSLIPKKPGERVKTDRRDARKLAELLQAGLLTEIRPPTQDEEAVRDLCRARGAAVQDRTACRHRLSKFLLRKGLRWASGRSPWTQAHRKWLRSLSFELEAEQLVFNSHLLALEQVEGRVDELEGHLERLATTEPYHEAVGWPCCFRGIKVVTAMTILTELHGFERFHSPRQLMSFLGLTPSEESSGGRRRLGAITKAGNAHVRRVLVEAAWHYQHPPSVGKALRKRREGQPGWAIATAEQAHQRPCRRFRRLTARGKERNKATVAVARELVGFIWALLGSAGTRTA